jgi:hypothetical protein
MAANADLPAGQVDVDDIEFLSRKYTGVAVFQVEVPNRDSLVVDDGRGGVGRVPGDPGNREKKEAAGHGNPNALLHVAKAPLQFWPGRLRIRWLRTMSIESAHEFSFADRIVVVF